jgi:GDP-L-fucose synthase
MNFGEKRFVVTGGAGFLGRHVCQKLVEFGANKDNIFVPRSVEYDLRSLDACRQIMGKSDIVIHLAAKVGGLWAHVNKQADFFYDNAMMSLNMVHAAQEMGIEKFVGLGTVCEYPDNVAIPFSESDLWSGYPSKITAPYGLGKKTMLVAGDAYRGQYGLNAIHLLLINLYGPGDDFDPAPSHAVPALIRRVREAIEGMQDYLEVWGDGTASRELLFVEDAAKAIVLATAGYNKPEPVNIGSGIEIPIKHLAELICKEMGFKGFIRWDTSKVGGQHRRQLDVSLAEKEFGFRASTSIEVGLRSTINWFLNNY